ncbi:PRC and DUF2382 domain-containing protein [Deinococcus hohokamensis]|uniref:PRC and DUF2382 domain-containing protein n=1 Tax=Deinococcus hohokamensis TaxID=309883 RepID=A0ABV9IA89_9DEIO
MSRLIPISELTQDRKYELGEVLNPVGQAAYGLNGERVGTVREALTEEGGPLRYLVVDVGGWSAGKEVMVPVGLARIEDDGVYFDTLTQDQVRAMSTYTPGQADRFDEQVADERVLHAADTQQSAGTRTFNYRDEAPDTLFRTPQRLQLLEERLIVNKERYVASVVELGKHVETTTQSVEVSLQREEVVIERHPVSGSRPVSGDVPLGSATETVHVDLEAERAQIGKQVFVAEEVSVEKRLVTEVQTVSETVGREVLDVRETGEVRIAGKPAGTAPAHSEGQNLVERAMDTVKDAVDPLDGKIDRR